MAGGAGAALAPAGPGLVGRGLVAAWERQCRLVPGAALYRHDGLVVAVGDPGGPSATAVLVERPPLDAAHALEVAEGLAAAHAGSLVVELAAGTHPGVEAALVAAGYRPGRRRPAMVAPLTGRPRPAAAPAMGAGTRLRPATAGDLEPLRRLEVDCFGSAPATTARTLTAAALADPTWWTTVAHDVGDGTVRAKAHGHLQDGALGVVGVATSPPARRRGLASSVVAHLLDRAAGAGAGRAWLVAEPDATGLYLRLGFVPVAEWLTWARP